MDLDVVSSRLANFSVQYNITAASIAVLIIKKNKLYNFES